MKMKLSNQKLRGSFLDILVLVLACSIGSFASVSILVPNGLSAGGLAGLTRILQALIPGLDYGFTFYGISLVILVLAALILGMREAKKLVFMAFLYPTVMVVFEKVNFMLLEEEDLVLAAIYFGALSGACSGLIFSRGYSICGTDAIAKIIKKKLAPGMNLSTILLYLDGGIILVSGIFYGRNIALYALISQFIFSKAVEIILFGMQAKVVRVEITTTEAAKVSDYILHDLNRGVTISTVVGAYTMRSHENLMTYCSPRESVLIRKYLSQIDPKAFLSVEKVEGVWGKGNGFRDLNKEVDE
ncbi:MAG: YitT family protein [Firmicutes bacterium]|nr:YitT family protein [Bacillota bacterium]